MHRNSALVTVIGFGAFGRMVAECLAPHCAVAVYDTDPQRRRSARTAGFVVLPDLGEIRSQFVILAVPVQAIEACLLHIRPHLRAGQIVVDVCSIKEEPARLMQTLLPDEIEILATHPMFGPASAQNGLAGLQIVFCPVRGATWRRLAAFVTRKLGLDLVVVSPAEHDRQAALSQGLLHLLARAVQPWGEAPIIRTRSYDLFAQAIAMVRDDTPDVFEAITQRNGHVAQLRARLLQALASPDLGTAREMGAQGD